MHISIVFGTKSQVAQLNLNDLVRTLHSDILFMNDDLDATFIQKIIEINRRFELAPRALIVTSDAAITHGFLQDIRVSFPQIQEVIDAQQLIPVPMTAPFWRARMEGKSRHAEFLKRSLDSLEQNPTPVQLCVEPPKIPELSVGIINEQFGDLFWRDAAMRTGVPARLLGQIAKAEGERGNTKREQLVTRTINEAFARAIFPPPLGQPIIPIKREHFSARDVTLKIKNEDGTYTKVDGFSELTDFLQEIADGLKNDDNDSQN